MKGFLLLLKGLSYLNLSKWVQLYQNSAKAAMILRLTMIIVVLLTSSIVGGELSPEAVKSFGESVNEADKIATDLVD